MTTTATNPLSTVIGVFLDHDQANSAIDELRHASFGYDRIRLVEHGTGGFVDTLKGMFTGQASMASSTADSLIKMGMPDYEAQHYQSELDANHVLLLMNANDRPEEAFNIMRQNGAFDLNLRLRVTPENGAVEARTSNGSQETLQPDTPAAAYPTAPQYPPNAPVQQAGAYPEAAPTGDYESQEAADPNGIPQAPYPNQSQEMPA